MPGKNGGLYDTFHEILELLALCGKAINSIMRIVSLRVKEPERSVSINSISAWCPSVIFVIFSGIGIFVKKVVSKKESPENSSK